MAHDVECLFEIGNGTNRYRYNGKEFTEKLGLYDYGARWYDPAVARFTSIDRFASKYSFQAPYVYAANNPIKFIDVNGDSIGYANQTIQQYVEKFTSPTITTRKGKVKRNKNYNEGFAALVSALDGAEEMFIFSDDATLLENSEETLGGFTVQGDGSHFNIIAPTYNSGEKSKLLDLAGGRAAILAEETKHATQYLNGDFTAARGRNGKFSFSVREGMDVPQLEAEAKLWVSNSGMARLSTNSYADNYTIPTYMGLIKTAGSVKEVRRILLSGTTVTRGTNQGSGSMKTFRYPPTYSPF